MEAISNRFVVCVSALFRAACGPISSPATNSSRNALAFTTGTPEYFVICERIVADAALCVRLLCDAVPALPPIFEGEIL